MKSYEMVETLSARAHVTPEQAKMALERSNWDILDAAIYIERHRQELNASAPKAPAPNTAYFVSGFQHETQGAYATPGFGRQGSFDPRTDFNRPNGGFTPPPPPPHAGAPMPPPPPVPPYKDFPNRGGQQTPPTWQQPPTPEYKAFPQQPQPGKTAGEYVGRAAGTLENGVNTIFNASFIVTRHDSVMFVVPLLVFVILLVAFFWVALPVLVFGLAFDCKYSIGKKPAAQQQPISEFVDRTVNTALDTAERAKETILRETAGVRSAYEQSRREFAEDYKKGKESVTGTHVNLHKD